VRVVQGVGGGAGAARNLGWQAATGELVWFIDSDCVAEPEALARLLWHLESDNVVGVGGSYANGCPESLVASLIHEEILARHRRMPTQVDYLATFNVLYRRAALAAVGGFDEQRFNGPGIAAAEDVELAFRLIQAGYELRFEAGSRVAHFHPTNLWRYLATQRRHGFYRVRLHLSYPRSMHGDAYSGLIDYAQPPLALLWLAWLPLSVLPGWRWLPMAALLSLVVLQLPMCARMVIQSQAGKYLAFMPFGVLRAVSRGLGMAMGLADWLVFRPSSPSPARHAEWADFGPFPLTCSSLASVVVCVYNRPVQILECLASLAASLELDYEIVVVDDASTDDTPHAVRRFAAAHPQISLRLVTLSHNAGVSGARNAGIQAARGGVVLFIDSDCLADPDWLGQLAQPLRRERASAASGLVLDPPPRNLCELSFFGNLTLRKVSGQNRKLAGCNMGFRREVLLEHPFDEQLTNYCDEDDVCRRIAAAGHTICFVPSAKVWHCHPMQFKSYMRQAIRHGRGAARYWFKHRVYLGRDVLCGALGLLSLPLLLCDLRWGLLTLLLFALQLGANWFNEWWLKGMALSRSLVVLPVASTYNFVKTCSALWTLVKILAGQDRQFQVAAVLKDAQRVSQS
jgi:GT2 family glycosyltransferase